MALKAHAHAAAAVPLPQQPASQLPPVAVLAAPLPSWAEAGLRGVDPFWQPKETLAVIVTVESAPAPGTHGQLQSRAALFTLSAATLAELRAKRLQARLVCVQPNDPPPNRCHWYGGSYVLINGLSVEVTKEDRVSLLLPPNQADQAVDVSQLFHATGTNRLTFFWPTGIAGAVVALRLCAPLAPGDLLLRLAPPLPLERLVAAVRSYAANDLAGGGGGDADGGGNDASGGGGGAGEGGGSAAECTGAARGAGADGPEAQQQAEVASEAAAPCTDHTGVHADGGLVRVSLRCPLSGGLVASPAHFGNACGTCNPLAFFESGAFLEQARATGSWCCPATARRGGLDDLRPHAYLTAVLRTLEHNGCRGRVEAIEVCAEGTWRPSDSHVPFLSVLDPAPPTFDPRLLDPEDQEPRDVLDLTDD